MSIPNPQNLVDTTRVAKCTSSAERRAAERYHCNFEVDLRSLDVPDLNLRGRLRDVSVNGFGLILDRQMNRGTILVLKLPAHLPIFAASPSGCVIHCTPQPQGDFLVGCVSDDLG